MPKKMKPGKLTGPSHKRGGILLEAEGGEYIIKKSSVKKLGKRTLDKINKEGKLPMKKGMKKYYGGGMAGMSKKRMMMEKGGMAKKSKSGRAKNLLKKMPPGWKIGDPVPPKRMEKPIGTPESRSKRMTPLKKKASGGKVGDSIKTYGSGGYVEGK